ncbi:MAG TPA: DUF2600 family protein [Conexibacter sp.]|jgi:tetraprenyl-beta-curcumene synthase
MIDTMPLQRPQRSALLSAGIRELGWGLWTVSAELRALRERAAAIPDPWLRADALHALDSKRGHSDGAALFWTLPARRHPGLLRLLLAYDVIYDYLDDVGERAARELGVSGPELYQALVDALDPSSPQGDYYAGLPWRDDAGYLHALVDLCRAECSALPSFALVRPLIEREVSRFAVLALNHEDDGTRRDAALETWAREEFGDGADMRWFELTAASSQSIVTLALLALATDPLATVADAEATYHAYFPWWAYAVTMIDSYVDQAEDRWNGAHSYISHYPSSEIAVARLCESVERSAERLLALPNGERHAVLLACMVAMYLSKDSARDGELRETTRRIVKSGGTLTAILLPVLRAWRIVNRQTSAT